MQMASPVGSYNTAYQQNQGKFLVNRQLAEMHLYSTKAELRCSDYWGKVFLKTSFNLVSHTFCTMRFASEKYHKVKAQVPFGAIVNKTHPTDELLRAGCSAL